MKPLIVLTGVFILYFIYGFYISQADSSIIPLELIPKNPDQLYDYRGVSNVQTDRANGSSNPLLVINDAKKANLDFLILTDTNKQQFLNGYHDDLLVLDESEHSFLDSRLLLINSETPKIADEVTENTIFLTDLLTQKFNPSSNQLLVLAHPFRNGPTWSGPYPGGLDGIEVLNPKSISKAAWDRSKLNVLWSFITYPFNPRLSFLRLFREPDDEISLWDKLLNERPVWGFAGADANARAIPIANYLIKFPSYLMSFGITSNHILLPTELTGSYEKDRLKIFSALKKGQFYFALDLLGNPKGFVANIFDRDKSFQMGSSIKFNKNLILKAKIPIEPKYFYELVVFKNGEKVSISNTKEITYEIKSPGVYRIQVRVSPYLPIPDGKKWITWIYTNPFFVN